MALNNGLGRPRIVEKYTTVHEYLNKYIFIVKDAFFALQNDERKKEKQYNAARGRRILQQQKLENAYEGLEHFRK